MQLTYVKSGELKNTLENARNSSLDFIVLSAGALFLEKKITIERLIEYLGQCVRILKNGGLLFVHGRPDYLPELGVYLDEHLNFKYWISVDSTIHQPSNGLPSVHAGLLLFSKGEGRFNIKQTRFTHQMCSACGKTLKDWGGKTHLMNPEGYAISDVWKDLPKENNYSQISNPLLDTILRLIDFQPPKKKQELLEEDFLQSSFSVKGLIAPKEGVSTFRKSISEKQNQYLLPGFVNKHKSSKQMSKSFDEKLFDVVQQGDAIDLLRQYPDNSIDLVFADPPYNLDKSYSSYNDGLEDKSYLEWCNAWLKEYTRILKPTGSLFVLNLPRWTMHHANFLNKYLYLQNWIVWDAMSEPRGKLMPAHYGLLFYTKDSKNFTFNYHKFERIDARYYCRRASCIRKRKKAGDDDKQILTDIWWDIHRIKHKRDRDYHPCQLPEKLMERIIQLTTNKGDIVLDALAGAGTTPVVASRLGRHYIAIDVDDYYVDIMRKKLQEIKVNGTVLRQSTRKPNSKYTKKELQLELRKLASELGRLPTPNDVVEKSSYEVEVFFDKFPSWGKALKAAKLEVGRD